MTRVVPQTPDEPMDLRERFVTGGLGFLTDHGAGELTVRRAAKSANSTTMCLYTKFGGRAGLLEAIYQRGFELLSAALSDAPATADPTRRILDLALAYRRFALANPSLYALMFQRPVPDFDPPPDLRRTSLERTFPPLTEAVTQAQAQGVLSRGDPARSTHLLWCVIHGVVSDELAHTPPPPDGNPGEPGEDSREQILVDALQATLTGLHPIPATTA
jgi:AcrR family transcriptional regulator